MQQRSTFLIFLLILIIGVLVRLVYIFSEIDLLIRFIPDDAFYYFQTAKHIVAGNGSTFDGLHKTNGYHPLWMMFLLPIALVISEPILFTRFVLLVSTLLCSLTAVVLYFTIYRVTLSYRLSALGFALFFLNPVIILESINGLETNLTNLIFVILIYLIINSERVKGLYIYLGITAGLLFLARTDAIFFIVGAFAVHFLLSPKLNLDNVKKLFVTGAISLILILPWIIWNWINFGEIIQTSGFAVPYIIRENFILNGGTQQSFFLNGIKKYIDFLMKDLARYLGYPRTSLILIISIISMIVLRDRAKNRKEKILFKLLLFLWIAGLSLTLIHVALRSYPRPWYFTQIIIVAILTIVLAFHLLNIKKGAGWLYVLVLLIISLSSALLIPKMINGAYFYQPEMLDAAYWLKENAKDDQISGSFNGGIVAFFSGKRVINLDGVINNSAFAAIRDKKLLDYIEENEIDYYLDYHPIMLDWYAPFLGRSMTSENWQQLAIINRPEIKPPWDDNQIVIYRVLFQH